MRFAGVTPIDDVSVVFPGGTCGLIGPNGAGKTTFFNVLSGFVKPAAGSIAGLRREPAQDGRLQARALGPAAHLPDGDGDRAAVGVRQRGDDPRALGRRSRLAARPTCWPRSSSSGWRSRRRPRSAGSARASGGSWRSPAPSSATPRVVLLDEPAAGLPDEETEQLSQVIQKIPEQFGALVILVDHDMSLVSACCETTAVLDFGKLIASGPTAEVLRNEHVMRAYLGTEDGAVSAAERRRRRARAAPRGALRRPRRTARASTRCRWRSRPARSRRCSARTAPASRRSCSRSAACCARAGGKVHAGRRATSPACGPSRCAPPASRSSPRAGASCRNLTVQDNLRVATYALSPRATRRAGSAYALELFPELEKRWDVDARLLSGGEQQMVVLAQALVSRPEDRARRRALARPRAGRRQAARADPRGRRRERRRRAPDRAVRARRARARADRATCSRAGASATRAPRRS